MVDISADWVEAFEICRVHYKKEHGLGAADPLPAEMTKLDRRQLNADLVLMGMLSAVIVSVVRDVLTEELLTTWAASGSSRTEEFVFSGLW